MARRTIGVVLVTTALAAAVVAGRAASSEFVGRPIPAPIAKPLTAGSCIARVDLSIYPPTAKAEPCKAVRRGEMLGTIEGGLSNIAHAAADAA